MSMVEIGQVWRCKRRNESHRTIRIIEIHLSRRGEIDGVTIGGSGEYMPRRRHLLAGTLFGDYELASSPSPGTPPPTETTTSDRRAES